MCVTDALFSSTYFHSSLPFFGTEAEFTSSLLIFLVGKYSTFNFKNISLQKDGAS
jgi:hypothetical protein